MQPTIVNLSRFRKRLAGSAVAWSLITAFQGQFALLISGVIAARLLGVHGRGVLALVLLIPGVLSLVAGSGTPGTLVYYIAGRRDVAARLARHIDSILRWQIAAATIAHFVVIWLLVRHGSFTWVPALIALPGTMSLLLLQYGLAYLQAEERYGAFNVLRALPATMYAVGLVMLLLAGSASVAAVAGLWLIAQIVPGLLAVALGRPSPASTVAGDPRSRDMMLFGLRGFLGTASPVETFRLDQLLVGFVLSPAALGLYVTGVAFSNFPRFVSQSIGMVAYPRVARRRLEGVEAAFAEVGKYFAVGLCFTAVVAGVLYAGLPFLVPLLFGEEFTAAVTVARLLVMGSALMSLRRLLAEGAKGLGLPALGSLGEVASWVVFIPLLVVLAPRFGIEGVATAVVVAGFVSAAIVAGLILHARSRAVSRKGHLETLSNWVPTSIGDAR